MTRILSPRIILLGVSAILVASLFSTSATQMMNDVIVGTVTSSAGPEAGVWVIAETTDLPTRYIKEVVTDDQGRYLIPALPQARYTVWARGYGLVEAVERGHAHLQSVLASPQVCKGRTILRQGRPGIA